MFTSVPLVARLFLKPPKGHLCCPTCSNVLRDPVNWRQERYEARYVHPVKAIDDASYASEDDEDDEDFEDEADEAAAADDDDEEEIDESSGRELIIVIDGSDDDGDDDNDGDDGEFDNDFDEEGDEDEGADENALEEETVCERCARDHGEITSNEALREVINDLEVCCFSHAQPLPSLSPGVAAAGGKRKSDADEAACTWTGKFAAAEEHYSTCPSALALCGNGCGSTVVRRDLAAHLETCKSDCPNGCGLSVAGKDMSRHLDGCRSQCILGCGNLVGGNERDIHKRTCPQRTVACEWCAEEFHFQEVADHRRGCDMRHVHCPHRCVTADGGDAVLVPFAEIDEHLLTCPMMPVKCCYAPLGCDITLPRCQMDAHESDPAHMAVLGRRIFHLQNEVVSASRTISQLQGQLAKHSGQLEKHAGQLAKHQRKIEELE